MTRMRAGHSRALRSNTQPEPGPPIGDLDLPGGAPGWGAVDDLIRLLARTHAVFPTATSPANWISSYEPGRRFMLEGKGRSSWIRIEDLKACWETFERRRRIERRDVLEPGRCSALVMALFAHVEGVQRGLGKEPALVLPDADGASAA